MELVTTNLPALNQMRIALVLVLLILSTGPCLADHQFGFSEGYSLYSQGQYRKAADLFSSYLRDETASRENYAAAYYYLAGCYYGMHNLKSARAMYAAVVKSFPQSKEAKPAALMLKRLGAGKPEEKPIQPAGTTSTQQVATAESTGSNRYKQEYAKLPQENRVRFTRADGGHMLVRATINKRPMMVMFDTGASGYFGKNHLRQAGLPVPTGKPDTYAVGWAGKKVPSWRSSATVTIGDMTRTIPITISEHFDMKPLIGRKFVKDLHYEIDEKGGYIIFKKPHTHKSGGASDSSLNRAWEVPIRQKYGNTYVEVEYDRKKRWVLLDTGASMSILSLPTANSLGIQPDAFGPAYTSTGVGGSFKTQLAQVDMRMGPINKPEFSVHVGGNAGDAVGQDFLSGFRFTIDKEKNLLRFFH